LGLVALVSLVLGSAIQYRYPDLLRRAAAAKLELPWDPRLAGTHQEGPSAPTREAPSLLQRQHDARAIQEPWREPELSLLRQRPMLQLDLGRRRAPDHRQVEDRYGL
jgi:hypothetical protein